MGFVGVSPFLVTQKKASRTRQASRARQAGQGRTRQASRTSRVGTSRAGTRQNKASGAGTRQAGTRQAGQGNQNKTGLNTEQSELDVVLDQELIQGVPTTISVQDHCSTLVNHDPCLHEFRFRNQVSFAKIATCDPTTGTGHPPEP